MRRSLAAVLAGGAVLTLGSAVLAGDSTFNAHLKGATEVPVRSTHATGNAVFKLSEDGTELSYRLIVANIDNVVQAHIHIGPPGVEWAVVAFLYGPAAAAGGRESGVLSTGTITAANLVGPLLGIHSRSSSTQIEAGNAYVNVHTNDGNDTPTTGPGDFPGGEIRGPMK